ncbi:MAG: AbrB/MazE/SpoVT family DNA-binding domain-containing protein [Spirochaetes bacterium]|nr:AbrB/MazE/SpoVT family DNA-binding domain-containing protein [Spirochaetota bacterium]
MVKKPKPVDKTLYGVVTVSSKGQIIIPVGLRKELGINDGDQLYIMKNDRNDIVLMSVERMEGILKHYGLRGAADM